VRVAENDYVMTFGEMNVVHNGAELFGLPASGKHILVSSCHIYRREGDRFAEDFCLMDMTGFFQQLGIDVLKRVREQRFFQRV
jgi:predicted ester cyclase